MPTAAACTGSGTSAQPPGPSTASSKKRRGARRVAGRDLGGHARAEALQLRGGMELDRGRLMGDDAAHELRPAAGQLERQQGAIGGAHEVDRAAGERLDHADEVVLVAPAGRRLLAARAGAVPAAVVGVDREPLGQRPRPQAPGGLPRPRAVHQQERLADARRRSDEEVGVDDAQASGGR